MGERKVRKDHLLSLKIKYNIKEGNCTVCSDEGLTLETSATHQIQPQAKNIPYQPLLIRPVYK